MENHWYIISNGKQEGPMPMSDLRRFGLAPESVVWTPGMAQWERASQCPELSGMLASGSQTINLDKEAPAVEDSRHVENVVIDDNVQPQRIPDPNNPGNWINAPYGAAPNNYGNNGQPYGAYGGYGQQPYGGGSGKSNLVAGLLAIFLGYLGVQYFYIGKVGGGLLTILLSLITCGAWSIITLIQGIYMITMTEQQFDQKFVYNPSTMPLF